ncbi:MAG: hypothetical protein IKI05_06615 [Bacteroidaceae bacterium]|nr:hypothetical protein [Bacteroidaceae bacterium]MBR7029058.1 hypothetical protein [Bacteroidaceae bacterium]
MSAYSKQDSRQVIGRFHDNDTFWDSFCQTVPLSPRAYLGTYLKEACRLQTKGLLNLRDARFEAYAKRNDVSNIDRHKITAALLPLCKQWQEAEYLINLFTKDDLRSSITALLQTRTLPCYYVLFRQLRQHEGDATLHRNVCIALIKHGTTMDFNFAALLSSYFDVQPLPATFALRLQPYELSRFDDSYENFKAIIGRS